MPRWDLAAELCGNCGHWSESSESGLTPGTGYCDYWEKLTDRAYTCDYFVTRKEMQAFQRELAQENEAYLDDA